MRTRRTESSSNPASSRGHASVLLHEVVAVLDVQPSDTVLDATLGGAGHARSLAEMLGKEGTFIGIDADGAALKRAEEALSGIDSKIQLIKGNFRNMRSLLLERSISRVDKILFDLGWSAYTLTSGRGFSFQGNEPLLMTYEDSVDEEALTAKLILNTWGEENIADVLYGFGGERFSRRIARAIVEHREKSSFETTQDLVSVVEKAVPAMYRTRKIHPATKTFQALRIAVNDELEALAEALVASIDLLNGGGRVAVLTFHSTEDRLVKRAFKDFEQRGFGQVIEKIKPTTEETTQNPRARSALLRTFEKTETKS